MLTRDQAMQIVREAYEKLREFLPVRECWLYGSYARGDYDEESDLDILVTVDADEQAVHAFRRTVSTVASRLSLAHDITVSIAVKPEADFHRRAVYVPYYKNVLTEGKAYAV